MQLLKVGSTFGSCAARVPTQPPAHKALVAREVTPNAGYAGTGGAYNALRGRDLRS